MKAIAILLPILLLASGWCPAGAGDDRIEARIDVGGYRLQIDCRGRGRPAVIMDHGLGGSSSDWKKVQRRLSETTRACVYDRAGYGSSDAGPMPRVSARIAAELRTLLHRTAVAPPYVLAGHSFGGYNMRMFAALFPKQTAGLVLVDTPSEEQMDGLFENQIMHQIDRLGLLEKFWTPQLVSSLRAIDLAPLASLIGFPEKTLQAILAELAGFRESSNELRAADIHRESPLVVILHGRRVMPTGPLGDDMERQWLRLQRALAAQYRNSTVIVAADSGHNIPSSQPELVADSITRLVRASPMAAEAQP